MIFKNVVIIAAVAVTCSGCAMSSDVMDAGNGEYLISSHASAIRGGATGANSIAYEDAQKFCASKRNGTHAIVADARERDVYQSSVGGSVGPNGGSFGGGTFASGNVNLRFRCGK